MNGPAVGGGRSGKGRFKTPRFLSGAAFRISRRDGDGSGSDPDLVLRRRALPEGVGRFEAAADHMADRLLCVEGRVGAHQHVREGTEQRHITVGDDVADAVVVVEPG